MGGSEEPFSCCTCADCPGLSCLASLSHQPCCLVVVRWLPRGAGEKGGRAGAISAELARVSLPHLCFSQNVFPLYLSNVHFHFRSAQGMCSQPTTGIISSEVGTGLSLVTRPRSITRAVVTMLEKTGQEGQAGAGLFLLSAVPSH